MRVAFSDEFTGFVFRVKDDFYVGDGGGCGFHRESGTYVPGYTATYFTRKSAS